MTDPSHSRQPTFTSPETTVTVAAGPASIRYVFDASRAGAFSVIEFRAAPGFIGPPMLHHHTREEASFMVLEGTLIVAVGGTEHHVAPGGFAHLPPGVDFTWRNASAEQPARFLCVYAPAGFEGMFLDAQRAFAELGAPPSPAAMREVMPPIWSKYGIGLPTG